jgi:hypothetical protein
MTPGALLDLLTEMLAAATGKGHIHWMKVLGPVMTHPLSTHPRCNWSISPKGTRVDVDAAAKAIAIARERHPHIEHGA